MSLLEKIQDAVECDRYIFTTHARSRCHERRVAPWQVATGLKDATVVRIRHGSKPNPSVVVRQSLADGSEVMVIWAWESLLRRAILVTVFFNV